MSNYPRIGGSSAERIIYCPGSVMLSQAAPPETESGDAKDGTIAHKLAELCLLQGLDPEEMVGRFVKGQEIDPQMAQAVDVYVSHVRGWFTDESGQIDIEAFAAFSVERFVKLESIDPACGGTTDAVQYLPNKRLLRVGDYKNGVGVPVEVTHNKQLRYYALGAWLELGDQPVDAVELTVVQPNCPHREGPVRSITIDPFDLIEFGMELKAAIDLSRKPGAPLLAGRWCQFCPAKGFCPKLFAHVKEAMAYEVLDAQTAEMGGLLEPDEMGQRLALVEPLRHWINGIQRYAFGEAQRGRIPTGYKLVRVRSRRKWSADADPSGIADHAKLLFGVSDEALWKKKLVTPRQLEKIVGAKEAEDFLRPYVAEKSSAVSLVPATDRREAVEPNAALEFADINGDDNVE